MQNEKKQCVICMDDDNDDTFYTIAECNHSFHTNCIMSWFRSLKTTCPCCKSSEPIVETNDKHYKRKFFLLQRLNKSRTYYIPTEIRDIINDCANRIEIQKDMHKDLVNYQQKAKGDYKSIRRNILRKNRRYEKYVSDSKEMMKEIASCNVDQIIIPIRKVYMD